MSGLIIFVICGVGILTTDPTDIKHSYVLYAGEYMAFLLVLYGVQCIKLRVRVDSQTPMTKGLLGWRTRPLSDIGEVRNQRAGRYRTLSVFDRRGKRVFLITSSFLTDYPGLVRLIREGSVDRHAGVGSQLS